MSDHETMTVGDWFFTLVLMCIPLVNVVCFLVWLFGAGNRNRVNYCRATFLIGLIGFVVAIALGSMGVIAFSEMGM